MARAKESTSSMGAFLKDMLPIPQVEALIEGIVFDASKNEVHIDIPGYRSGVIRGPELFDESGEYAELQVGATVQATVLELENENGEVELSFRQAGHKKAWDELKKLFEAQDIVDASVVDANKGGLIIRVGRVSGFLPVSQLTIEHYPRVEGGNKQKILERLKTYSGQIFKVRIINVDDKERTLIVSEKAAWEDRQQKTLSKYKIGDVVEGKITGVVDFGAFVEFDEGLEGLVHISEIAWQRIDDPRDFIKVGDQVKAQIISIDASKVSLSIRRLLEDPWAGVAKKYKVGDAVEGLVLKTNPFGVFVELDKDIHGLCHISELSSNKVESPKDVVEPGKNYTFKIISLEPKEHRLGLSLKALQQKDS